MPQPAPRLAAALTAAALPWEADAPLRRRLWWRCGGPADALVTARTPADVARAVQIAHDLGEPLTVLGNGSNALVADAGVRGLTLVLDGLDHSRRDGDLLHLGAGLRLVVLLARARKEGWPGLEALAGIPGTVGGAVPTNAGTALGELGDLLHDLDAVLPDGREVTLDATDLRPRYRAMALPPGAVVTAARLRTAGDVTESLARMADHLARRKATQPLDLPSCGSTFTNPPGDAAGRLLDAAGLKGFTQGAAQVSPKHANFVVNLGDARATDVLAVIRHAERVVHDVHGVRLHREVRLLGDWEGVEIGAGWEDRERP